MKRSWKINLQKPLNERDLIDFFNLIAALHNQKHKPNANGHPKLRRRTRYKLGNLA